MIETIKCRFCGSKNFVKKGFRKTQNRGKIQKYFCRDCSKFFVEDNGFLKMKNNPQKITCGIDLFYRGVSTRKVQEHFKAFYPHNSSHMSIYRWIIKYSNVISKFTDKIKLNVGSEIQVDEMEYHRRKSRNRKGVSKDWFIDSIDTKTRFMVSSQYVKSREQREIRQILNTIRNKTQKVEIITTDGHPIYQNAVKRVFGYNFKLGQYKVLHNVVNASRGEGFNIMIERLHNNIRARTKTFRGFHGSVESANSIMKGWEVYYNFITKHQAINKCPYELATDLKLNSENKWLELISLSLQKNLLKSIKQ